MVSLFQVCQATIITVALFSMCPHGLSRVEICASRCITGRGGNLCNCYSTHFVGKRLQPQTRDIDLNGIGSASLFREDQLYQSLDPAARIRQDDEEILLDAPTELDESEEKQSDRPYLETKQTQNDDHFINPFLKYLAQVRQRRRTSYLADENLK